MATVKSSAENLTLNADGSGNDIIFQSNGSQVGSLTAEGVLTATSFAGSGASLTGITSVGGATGVDFNDNVKARFGTGNDIEIYHDGSDSFIKSTNGPLMLQNTNSNIVLQAKSGEAAVICIPDGEVELRHDNATKFATSATGVTVTGAIAGATNLGKVLQVVQTSDTGQETSTSSGWNDLGNLSLSITPSSTSSKIYLMCHLGVIHQTQDTHIVYFRFLRDSTAVGVGSVGSRTGCTASTRGQGTGDTNAGFNMAFNYLDSPSTTSAITYKVQYHNFNSGEFHYNRDDGWADTASHPTPISTITAMEIA
jgi:hypothetical protein